ncbi:MAG: hypothetical protein IPH53_13695 [Flavobacteriales bacterium]|nr:hypothetical protein [Flavobacteriales bacterium]
MERLLAYGLLSVLFFSACKKEENPFDTIEHTEETTVSQQLPLTNFAGLHQRIFRPTCAVSGCHDGTFEPEFRTIASAYNSLVYHPVIANDPQESFTYRVLPGNAQASFLHERLTVFVANTSGVMPLDVTTDSDWPANDDAYISAITAWINNGAKDMFGQAPTLGNRQPQAIGFRAFPAGNTNAAYPREQGAGIRPIEVPAAQVDLWFAFDDDSTDASAFTYQTYRLATGPLAFGTVPELPLEIGATCVGPDFGGSAATFTHRAVLDLSAQPVGTLLLVRVHVNDGDHADPAELPNDGSSSDMTDLFTLKIVP